MYKYQSTFSRQDSLKKNTISIPTFKGDSHFAQFFFDLLKYYSFLNELFNEATIHLLKEKLSDSALSYLTENKTLHNATDLGFIQAEFIKFFGNNSYNNHLNEFNNLKLLPGKFIKNFAH